REHRDCREKNRNLRHQEYCLRLWAAVRCSYNYGPNLLCLLLRLFVMEVHSSQEPAVGTCCDSVETGTVERVAVATLPTEWGEFQIAAYRSLTTEEEFVVLFKGEMSRDVPTLVRIHSQCLTGDVFGSNKCDCGGQLHRTMQMIQQEGRGAIVYQKQEGRGI